MRVFSVFLGLTLTALTLSAQAGTLQDVRKAAQQADSQLLAAQRTWQADQQLASQARGALLPDISASYSIKRQYNTPEGYAEQEWTNKTLGVSLVQPLFRLDAWYGYQQAQAVVSANEAIFEKAKQDFLLRVATQYVNVLRTWDALQFALANEKAIGRQLEQTQERYKVGLVPVTDVQQAKSIYDKAKVTLITARSQFAIARDQLEALTATDWNTLAGLKNTLPMNGVTPDDPAEWIALAQKQNPQLIASKLQAKAKSLNAKVKMGEMLPKLNLVGGYQHQHGSARNIAAAPGHDADAKGKYIGLELSVPLFTGGTLNSQRKEAALRAQAAEATYKLTYRKVGQSARSQFRKVETDALRVTAGAQAIQSAQTALDAVREGYKVGTNTIIDVLDAESTLFQARSNYADARYDYLIDSLSLKATAGVLNVDDLKQVNTWLDTTHPIDLSNVNQVSSRALKTASPNS